MINYEALFKISYGLYVVSSGKNGKGNAYISNTVFQVTAEPIRFATCCNRNNYTAGFIAETGLFAVSVLEQEVSQDVIARLGYKSGKDSDKLAGLDIKTGETGVPVILNGSIAYLECRVVQTVDLGTHLMFIGDLICSELLDHQKEPLTYGYYHQVKKGLSPKNAPTYIPPEKLKSMEEVRTGKKFKCSACGYIYDEAEEGEPFADLPGDWVCPLCGAGKEEFNEL